MSAPPPPRPPSRPTQLAAGRNNPINQQKNAGAANAAANLPNPTGIPGLHSSEREDHEREEEARLRKNRGPDPTFGSAVSQFSEVHRSDFKNATGALGGGFTAMRAIGQKTGIPGLDTIGKFGEKLTGAIDKLHDWTDALHQSNMQFAEYSHSMAQVQAEALQREVELNRSKGEARAGSARVLEEGRSSLDTNTSEIGNLAADLKNYIGGYMDVIVGECLKPINEACKDIRRWLGKKDEDNKAVDTAEWMSEYGEKYYKEYGRPGRMK